MSVSQWIVSLPNQSERARRLTSTDEDALPTGSLLLESEGMRLGEVTYVDPASTCVDKEVVARRVGSDAVSDVVVEQCCGGVERSGRGDFMDGWLSW